MPCPTPMPTIRDARLQLQEEIIPALEAQLTACRPVDTEEKITPLISSTIQEIVDLCSDTRAKSIQSELEQLKAVSSKPAFDYTLLGQANWPIEVQSRLTSLVREALQNAQKHARAGEVRAVIITRASELTLTVTDDGVGISSEATGFGLDSTRQWVEHNGGSFSISSPPGCGATISLSLPLHSTGSSVAEISFGKALHDGVCQSLTGLTLLCGTLRDGTPDDQPAQWQTFRTATNAFKTATATCRSLAHNIID